MAVVESVDDPFGEQGTHADGPLGKAVGQAQHRRAHDIGGDRRPVPDPMVLDQAPVEVLDPVGRDPMALVLSKAGGHAVHRIAPREHALDTFAGVGHTLHGRRLQLDLRPVPGDGHDLRERQARAVQDDAHRPLSTFNLYRKMTPAGSRIAPNAGLYEPSARAGSDGGIPIPGIVLAAGTVQISVTSASEPTQRLTALALEQVRRDV